MPRFFSSNGMIALHDAYLAGLEVLAALGSSQDERRNRAAEIAPEFVKLAISFTYGEIFTRPGLDLRTRMLIAIAALVAGGGSPENLRLLVSAALRLGWQRREVVETIVQTAAQAGTPRALEALTECHELLAESNSCGRSCTPEETGQA